MEIFKKKLIGYAIAFEKRKSISLASALTINPNYRQMRLEKAFVTAIISEACKQLGCIKIILRKVLTENTQFFTNQRFIRTIPFKLILHYSYALELVK